jgi:hypothetical protein
VVDAATCESVLPGVDVCPVRRVERAFGVLLVAAAGAAISLDLAFDTCLPQS